MGIYMGLHREINGHCVARVSESAVHTRKAMSALQQCVVRATYIRGQVSLQLAHS